VSTHRVLMPTRPTAWRVAMPKIGGVFDYPVAPIGKVGLASIYYDTTLGAAGKLLAQQVYHLMPQAIVKCELDFGQACRSFNVIIAGLDSEHDGQGGAYHYGCDFATGRTIYADAAFGNPLMTLGLVVAELTECQMGQQGKGWGCGYSNGEALSRVLAELMSGGPTGALAAYASVPSWDQAGRPDWISRTEGTDQDYVSIGCGVAYIYWMLSCGFSIQRIIAAAGATLAANYLALAGSNRSSQTPYMAFMVAMARFPRGSITTDNPFG
jgi:hypothetical protein